MGLAETQLLKGLTPAMVYKGKKPTAKAKAGMKPKAPYVIPKQSAKAKARVQADMGMHSLDKSFYSEVWSASPHMCQCGCKTKLGPEPLTTYFHHLLEKQSYPQFRHTEENIMILATDCHKAINDGGLDKRPEVKRRTAVALKLLLK